MKKINLIIQFIFVFTIGAFSQSTLPDFKTMMNQGVPYDDIKNITEAAMDSTLVNDTTEGGKMNQYKRWLNYWEPRAYSTGSSVGSIQAYTEAMFEYHDLYKCNSTTTPLWKFRGPAVILDRNWGKPISVVGRVNAVAMHPSDLDVMYIGTSSSGIWKSTNLQDEMPDWVNISDGYGFDNIAVTDIVINPLNPNKIIVATGHVSFGYGIGILVSNDAGQSWEKTTLQYFNENNNHQNYVRQLVINHQDTSKVWALYSDSIKMSSDGGGTWQATGFSSVNSNANIKLTDIKLNKSDPSIVYVSGNEIWKKKGTDNWTRLDNLPSFNIPLNPGISITKRTCHISADSLGLYAIVQTLNTDTGYAGNRKDLLRYYESKNIWVRKRGQTHFCEGMEVSSVDSNIIYYWDIEWQRKIGKSVDEGASFEYQSKGNPFNVNWGVSVSEHMDIRDFELVTGSAGGFADVILVATDGGVLFSKNSYLNKNEIVRKNKNGNGLAITEFYGVVSVKYGKEFVALGAQDNSRFAYKNGQWNCFIVGDGYDGFITPDEEIYGQGNFPKYSVSVDYGKTPKIDKTSIIPHSNGRNITSIPNFKATKRVGQVMKNGDIYIARYDLAKKDVGSSGYHFISDFFTMGVDTQYVLVDLSVYEKNDDILFAAFPGKTKDNTLTRSKKIFRTIDGGVNWVDISLGILANVNVWHGIKSLIVDPNNPNNLWVTFDGIGGDKSTGVGANRVLRTTNALDTNPTWNDYSQGLPVFPMEEILFDENTTGRLYVASDVGVFYRDSDDPNSSWECFNHGIPDVTISDIDINYCNRTIYAATHGRGLWSADLLPRNDAPTVVGTTNGEVWNNDTIIKQSIKVGLAKKLIINNITVSFAAGAKLIVDQSASLVLNGTTITNDCGALWAGIEVWGFSEHASNTQYCPTGSSCLVGTLVMTDATIENAENAVSNWNPDDWDMRGGIIYATNTTFKNNRRDVAFMAYENHYNSGANNGKVAPYLSSFDRCNFIIDTNNLFENKPAFPARVTLWQVRGIGFNGCKFSNETGNYINSAGIYSWDANYTVREWVNNQGAIVPTTFEGFEAGIDASSSGLGYGFMVDTSHFTNCLYGVVANGVHNAVISRNNIIRDITRPTAIASSTIGIYLNGADQFMVTENNIDDNTVGIITRSTGGTENIIDRNGIENYMYGNHAYKDNNDPSKPRIGLHYNCNYHKNTGIYDILVDGGSGIAEFQGSANVAANNTFSDVLGASVYPYQQISNAHPSAVVINYYHHINSGGYTLEPVAVNPFTVVAHNLYTPIDLNQNCLSSISHFKTQELVRGRLTPQGHSEKRQAFNTALTNYNQAQYVYTSTIDGGDTYGLLNTVQTTNAQYAWSLRTQLINSSPLSAQVLMDVINQAVLSNALLLDVLMVNPHLSRDEHIIELLESKIDPMPAYMLNTFLGLFGVESPSDILLSQVAYESSQMHKNGRLLMVHWNADTTGDDWDSIPALLTQIPSPMADMQLVAHYKGIGNEEAVQNILNSIDTKYTLNTWQQSLVNEVQNFYGVYDNALGTGLNKVMELSSSTESSLETIGMNEDSRAGIYATSWLKFSNDQLYLPEIIEYEPSQNKKARHNIFKLREVVKSSSFELYPNPAQDFVTIKWGDYKVNKSLTVACINSVGVVVKSQMLLAEGTMNLNTSNLPTGLYFIQIRDGSAVVHQQMLEIVR